MTNMLLVIPYCANDAAQAEILIDWIYELQSRQKRGHALLVSSADCHVEMREKLKIAAELAFDSVGMTVVTNPAATGAGAASVPTNKQEWVRHTLYHSSVTVAREYRWPWLWVEPDCVPLATTWTNKLSEAYQDQPRRFLGPKAKGIDRDKKEFFVLGRVGVYPHDYTSPGLLVGAGSAMRDERTLERATTTRLIQLLAFEHGMTLDQVRADAVLLHSDKTGLLMRMVKERFRASQNGCRVEHEPLTSDCLNRTVQDLEAFKVTGCAVFENAKKLPGYFSPGGVVAAETVPAVVEAIQKDGAAFSTTEPSPVKALFTEDDLKSSILNKSGRIADIATRFKCDEKLIQLMMDNSGGKIFVGPKGWLKVQN